MNFCPHCGYSNHERAGGCLRCGRALSLSQPALPPPLPGGTEAPIRPAILWLIFACGALVLIVVAGWMERAGTARVQTRLAAEMAALEQAHEEEVAGAEAAEQERIAAEAAAHRRRLGDQRLLSGTAARERRAQEWRRRLAHEPGLAASAMEKTLLRMEQLGRDPALGAQSALEEVARLASPPGSRVEVASAADRFVVRVAFKMSAVTEHEAGAVTKHDSTASMRREIEELSARLIKELFDYCGSRGIERLSVSCNHTVLQSSVPHAATPEEEKYLRDRGGLVMSCLYRVSVSGPQAGLVRNWREVSVSEVIHRMRVEHDGLKTLNIRGWSTGGRQRDADMPLEF
jgi:hypothetical protein